MNTLILSGIKSNLEIINNLVYKHLFNTKYRNYGVSGSYGASIYGVQNTATNSRLVKLPPQKPKPTISINPRLHVSRWPGNIRSLRSNYFFRDNQKTNTGYYQMLIKDGDEVKKDLCFVSNIEKNLTCTKTIESCVSEQTRGFVGQVLLHGRGVKAYFEPEFPHLMFRLGVGSKCIDATRICTMYSKYVRVEVDRTGESIVFTYFRAQLINA
uniref:Uncharacterized protein n=1 Tax=Theileria annulata TaxID=5874 RepID=A0A3B0N913_THEAN